MKRIQLKSSRIFPILYLAGFSLFIMTLLITGNTSSYVHPRFVPFLWAGAVLAFLIIISMLILSPGEHASPLSWKKALILFIPLLFAFTVPPDVTPAADENSITGSLQSQEGPSAAVPEPVLLARKSESFPLDETRFYMIITDMYDNPSLYKGKRVRLTGMVFHKKNAPSEECAILRMLMTCCAADLQPVGLVCVMKPGLSFGQKAWVHAEGTISLKPSEQGEIPVLEVEKAEPAEKPAQEYIYPI